MLNTNYNWILENNINEEELNNKIKNINVNLSDITKKILVKRNIDTDEKINYFFNGTKNDMFDPLEICDMKKGVLRIFNAINNNEKVVIYGDYDVDGISSTSILYSFFKLLKLDVSYYIPSRLTEGYGMNVDAINKFKSDGINLIVTCDTGITAIEEAKLIYDLGMQLVVTDHHEMQNEIPKCEAVIDLKRGEDNYPFRELAGCGIAYKFVCAIDKLIKDKNENKILNDEFISYYNELNFDVTSLLEFASFGTISDIVPLVSENRIIVKEGLKLLSSTKRVGLKMLLEKNLSSINKITSRDILFYVVPKLNAAGRMDDASICVDLFLEEDESNAEKIIKELVSKNNERKKIEDAIFDNAQAIIEQDENFETNKIILVKNENWHHGVIGIVASKLVEKYFKPVVIFNEEEGMLQGSGRSYGSVNIFEILSIGKKYLSKFGGHEGACGLTLECNKYDDFKKVVTEYANNNITDEVLKKTISYDIEIDKNDITKELINELSLLEPYGELNNEVVFKFKNTVSHSTLMGKNNDHLKLKMKNDFESFDVVGFSMGNLYENISLNKDYEILGTLSLNEFMGRQNIQVMMKDIKNEFMKDLEIKYYKALYNKIKNLDFDNTNKDDVFDMLSLKNEEIISNVSDLDELISKDAYDLSLLENEENIENAKLKLYVINDLETLKNIANKYQDKVNIHYGDLSIKDAINSFRISKKPCNILTLNIKKFIDLRKNYSIIYIDSLESLKDKDEKALFDVSKDDVTKVYKRLNYLIKTNNHEIYLDDLAFNLNDLSIYKILISLEILKELTIINFEIDNDDKITFDINKDVKNGIENSKIFKCVGKV